MILDDFPFDEIVKNSNNSSELLSNIFKLVKSRDDFSVIVNMYLKICDPSHKGFSLEALNDINAMHNIDITQTLIETAANTIMEKLA